MLQDIRDKSQGWIAKAIIAVIVILMTATGYQAFFRSSHNGDEAAAKVNGEKIGRNQLANAIELQRRRLAEQFGPEFDASEINDAVLKDSALEGLIQQVLLLQGAEKAGFGASEQEINQSILMAPEFQVDGKFSPERYTQLVRQLGYESPAQFVEQLKKNQTLTQLRAGIAASAFATDPEVKRLVTLEGQTRDFAVRTLHTDPSTVKVTEEEIKQYYQDNLAQFMSPEQVTLNYLELHKQDFSKQTQVTDQDLLSLYNKEITTPPERRRAAHILIQVNEQQNDVQAKAKIEAISKRLEQGEDFAALAKALSQDSGSAAQGGDLGFADQADYEPDFEKALYSLKQGQVSQPVRTSFGWHVIKLLAVQTGEKPSFDSVKKRLTEELTAQQAEAKFLEASRALENSSFEASDLEQPAEELGLKVQTSAPFSREGGAGLIGNRKVIQAAFSDEVLQEGNNSPLIEPDADTALVLRVKDHIQPKERPLDTVSASIRQVLGHKLASERSKAEGEKLLGALDQQPGSADEAQWRSLKTATRTQKDVDPAILQQVFAMPRPDQGKPHYAGVSLANGDYVVIRLDAVSVPSGEPSKEALEKQRTELAARQGQQALSAYYQQLHDSAKIEKE